MAGKRTVIEEANDLIHGERQHDYGTAEESFGRVARLWSEVLGAEVTPHQVCLCMIQLKVARYVNGAQRDSLVDIIGYAGLIEELG